MITTESFVRLLARNVALELLAQVEGSSASVEVLERRDGVRVLVRIEVEGAAEVQPSPTIDQGLAPVAVQEERSTIPNGIPSPPARLRQVHRKILQKATVEPQPTKRLIAAAGYEVNTYSRDAVTHLCRLGYLERVPDGIRLGRTPAVG